MSLGLMSTSVVLLGCATLKQEGQAASSRALQQMLCVALNARHPSPMCEPVPVLNGRTAALPKQLFISHYILVWGLVYFASVYQRIFGVLDLRLLLYKAPMQDSSSSDYTCSHGAAFWQEQILLCRCGVIQRFYGLKGLVSKCDL